MSCFLTWLSQQQVWLQSIRSQVKHHKEHLWHSQAGNHKHCQDPMQVCHCEFVAAQCRLDLTPEITRASSLLHHRATGCFWNPQRAPSLLHSKQQPNSKGSFPLSKHILETLPEVQRLQETKHLYLQQVSKEFQEPWHSYSNPEPLETLFPSFIKFGQLKTRVHSK